MSIAILHHSHLDNRFNAAAWQNKSGNTCLVAREVDGPSVWGVPDKGNIIFVEQDPSGRVIHERTIWRVDDDQQHFLEDARAVVCRNGDVQLGFTAVKIEDGVVTPFPAVALWKLNQHKSEMLPEVTIIRDFGPGKNMTPLDEHGNYMFRPEGEENNHRLRVFNLDTVKSPVHLGDIDFPTDIPWAKWRIGTTMPPIPLNDHESLMIFHGITIKNGKYIYTLGKGILKTSNDNEITKRYELTVDYEPLITPDFFIDSQGQPMVEELHPDERRVVYACGGVLRRSGGQWVLSLFVNVGDRRTIEVMIPWTDLVDAPYISQLSNNSSPDLAAVA